LFLLFCSFHLFFPRFMPPAVSEFLFVICHGEREREEKEEEARGEIETFRFPLKTVLSFISCRFSGCCRIRMETEQESQKI
jgi:hypothetical protein